MGRKKEGGVEQVHVKLWSTATLAVGVFVFSVSFLKSDLKHISLVVTDILLSQNFKECLQVNTSNLAQLSTWTL